MWQPVKSASPRNVRAGTEPSPARAASARTPSPAAMAQGRPAAPAAAQPAVLRRDERDREADQRLDRRLRRPHPAERRERQREAVRDGEAGDDARDVGEPAAQEQQRSDEREVIPAREDVLPSQAHGAEERGRGGAVDGQAPVAVGQHAVDASAVGPANVCEVDMRRCDVEQQIALDGERPGWGHRTRHSTASWPSTGASGRGAPAGTQGGIARQETEARGEVVAEARGVVHRPRQTAGLERRQAHDHVGAVAADSPRGVRGAALVRRGRRRAEQRGEERRERTRRARRHGPPRPRRRRARAARRARRGARARRRAAATPSRTCARSRRAAAAPHRCRATTTRTCHPRLTRTGSLTAPGASASAVRSAVGPR